MDLTSGAPFWIVRDSLLAANPKLNHMARSGHTIPQPLVGRSGDAEVADTV